MVTTSRSVDNTDVSNGDTLRRKTLVPKLDTTRFDWINSQLEGLRYKHLRHLPVTTRRWMEWKNTNDRPQTARSSRQSQPTTSRAEMKTARSDGSSLLHYEQRKIKLSNNIVEKFQMEIEELERKMNALMDERNVLEEKCISLQGVLKVKDDEVIELTRLNKKILFMLGMREGEIADLYTRIEKNEDDLLFFEPAPGSAARSSSPYFNDIDYSAKKMNKDLVDLERDLQVKIRYSDRMQTLVSNAADLARQRVEFEAANRPTFAEAQSQTVCDAKDVEMLFAVEEVTSQSEDPEDMMNLIRKEHQSRRFHAGVPRAFRNVVMDSRSWFAQRDAREATIKMKKEQLDAQIMVYYFTKRDCDVNDELLGKDKSSLTDFLLEYHLYRSDSKADCDLELMDLINLLRHFTRPDEHARVSHARIFARLSGMSLSGKEGTALPQETLEFVLDVVYFLHEFYGEQMRRAAMSARQRAETKALKDVEIFANRTRKVSPASNLFVAAYKEKEKIMFKKSLVCRVVKEALLLRANIVWSQGDNLSFHEANRLMNLEQALDFSISHYEAVQTFARPQG
uniref:Uncharacterized protein n=1 Tax=Guillardia theta TaxID=55529 RepID=A0A7S4P9Y3_GUITH